MPSAPSLFVPGPLAPLVRWIIALVGRLPLPVITLPVPIQFIHEEDVGQALLLCIVGVGAPGLYNITGDGVLSGAQVLRELGLTPIPTPAQLLRATFRPGLRRLGGVDVAPSDHGRAQSQAGTRLAPAVQQPRGAARHVLTVARRPLPEDREAPLLGEPIHSVLDR
jgi:hypothetical protein